MDLHRLKIDRGTPQQAAPTAAAAPRRGSSRLALGVAVVLLVGAAALFGGRLRDAIDSVRLLQVRVLVAERESAAQSTAARGIAANGYIVASRRAALSADTPGRIVEMLVTEGSVVKKGDVVARLYADEYAAAHRRAEADHAAALAGRERAVARVEAARATVGRLEAGAAAASARVVASEAELALAVTSLQRAVRLKEDRIGNQVDVDQALMSRDRADAVLSATRAELTASQAAVQDAVASVRVAEADKQVAEAQVGVAQAARDLSAATLSKTEVRAPFDGVVVLKDAEVGEVVSPTSLGGSSARGSVATMVDFASLEVQCELPEKSLSGVVLGAPAAIYLDAFAEHRLAGRVDRIWPTANRQKATVEVRIKLEAPDTTLRPEMGCRVVFLDGPATAPVEGAPKAEAALPPAVLLPETAVVTVDGKPAVFVVERGVARARPVTIGARRGASLPVTDGLQGGERVVVDPPPSLEDGDRVRIQEG